ncbi:hypothetical protein C7M71_017095 [Peterkaempfera bronchialis]|uniref:Uncharacterized protein n=1 Tax=Peterkaempfera bronchialis TaxID=2126346 RepID=A0A345SYS0_9ACTN|nr:hypothetical protein C7M71_017095 [Peterkaempfera bronchialis]
MIRSAPAPALAQVAYPAAAAAWPGISGTAVAPPAVAPPAVAPPAVAPPAVAPPAGASWRTTTKASSTGS